MVAEEGDQEVLVVQAVVPVVASLEEDLLMVEVVIVHIHTIMAIVVFIKAHVFLVHQLVMKQWNGRIIYSK